MVNKVVQQKSHHLAIESLCAKVDHVFFEVLSHSIPAASYLLADIYCFRATAKDREKVRLCQTITKIKKHLQPSHIALLWHAVNVNNPVDWEVLSKGTQRSLILLRKVLLRQRFYLQSVDNALLLQLGKDPNWYREVMIALIRKHLWQKQLPDPFIYPHFSYHLVSQGGAEQNFLYMCGFIAQCPSLPMDELLTLGSHNVKIAELILKDLTNSPCYFQIGTGFARIHPQLRARIAKEWQHYLEIYALKKADDDYLHETLPELQKDFPEFRDVAFDNRNTRHYQTTPDIVAKPAHAKPQYRVIMLPAPIALLWYVFRRLNEKTQAQEQTQTQTQTESKTTQQPAWRRLLGW